MVERGGRVTAIVFLLSCAVSLAGAELLARVFLRVRNVGPSFSTYDPVLGKVHKNSFTTVRYAPEFVMRFSTNSEGFRGSEAAAGLPAKTPTILFVGDSFTEGYGVNDGEEFPALVRSQLRDAGGESCVRVVNAGIGDTGTGRALRFLRVWSGEHAEPTVLVYQLSANDLEDNVREGMFDLDGQGKLVERGGPVPVSFYRSLQPVIEGIPGLSYSYLLEGLQEVVRSLSERGLTRGNSAPGSHERKEQLMERLLDEVLELAARNRWPAIVIPVAFDSSREEMVSAVAAKHHVRVVIPPDKADHPSLYFKIDGHWNKEGHAHLARTVAPLVSDALAGLGQKPCAGRVQGGASELAEARTRSARH